MALVVLSVVEQRPDAVRAVLASADATDVPDNFRWLEVADPRSGRSLRSIVVLAWLPLL